MSDDNHPGNEIWDGVKFSDLDEESKDRFMWEIHNKIFQIEKHLGVQF